MSCKKGGPAVGLSLTFNVCADEGQVLPWPCSDSTLCIRSALCLPVSQDPAPLPLSHADWQSCCAASCSGHVACFGSASAAWPVLQLLWHACQHPLRWQAGTLEAQGCLAW